MSDIFSRNIKAVRQKNPYLAHTLLQTEPAAVYQTVKISKTGIPVPVLQSGQALHSLYDPEKEAEKMFGIPEGFVLFCGLGAGIQIRQVLHKNPAAVCALTEADYPSFRQLLSLIDFSDLFIHNRVHLLSPCTDARFSADLAAVYLPALHGNFTCRTLRTWELFFSECAAMLPDRIQSALHTITDDFSVQVHFGKIWMRNIFCNLRTAAAIQPCYPRTDTRKKALVLGAGPSLDSRLADILQNRQEYILFCCDTAFSVITAKGITPDFFIAIDPQHISCTHAFAAFAPSTVGIFDLCASEILVRRFYSNGNPLIFTVGGHPLAQYAAQFSPFPLLDTGSGTVAVSAYLAAAALGFHTIECTGTDFAYTDGKAYARGTYLSKTFACTANRLDSEQSKFIKLMFRGKTYSKKTKGHITYGTELLDSYRNALEKAKMLNGQWRTTDFCSFPYQTFITKLAHELCVQPLEIQPVLLPYIAWLKMRVKEDTVPEMLRESVYKYTGCGTLYNGLVR